MKQLQRRPNGPTTTIATLEVERPFLQTNAMITTSNWRADRTTRGRDNHFSVLVGGILVLLFAQGIGAGYCFASGVPDEKASATTTLTIFQRETPFRKRQLSIPRKGDLVGSGISYGPYREGQRPGGPAPTDAQLLEDLRIISQHWSMLRTYSSDSVTERTLQIIQRERLPLKVMVGAWIGTEAHVAPDGSIKEAFPDAVKANRTQVTDAIRLANDYSDTVLAVSVGNETQVSWSFHAVQPAVLANHVRSVRAGTKVPVTIADDFRFWIEPASKSLAAEIDFIVLHAYAMWNGKLLKDALAFTKDKYAVVSARHPAHRIVIGEAGWATQKLTYGEQKTRMPGRAGEDEQKEFYDAFTAWTRAHKITTFYFEAFDEPWKGGDDPNEVEKHWGLFRVDRTPKKAIK